MKIELQNIGMIKNASFKHNDLTIICGENNTGKTYATYTFYGFLEFLKDFNNSFLFLMPDVKIEAYPITIDHYDYAIINGNAKDVIKKTCLYISAKFSYTLPELLAGDEYKFKDSIFQLLLDKYVLEKFKNSKEGDICYIRDDKLYVQIKDNRKSINKVIMLSNFINERIIEEIIKCYQDKLASNVFIMSIERTGASMFERELAINQNEVLEHIKKNENNIQSKDDIYKIIRTYTSKYPRPVRDNVLFIRTLPDKVKQKSFLVKNENKNPTYDEILELFNQIAGGKYIISDYGGIEFAPGAKKRVTKGKYSIQSCSGSVRSLLMLNFYLNHEIKLGDLLIIDEPELNLHPKNQILLGRLFALLINIGVKVFITTHSDYIIRELSNCIMLNNLEDDKISNLKDSVFNNKYSPNMKLDPKRVSVYISKEEKDNYLHEVNIYKDTGIELETFNSVIEAQNDNQSDLYLLMD